MPVVFDALLLENGASPLCFWRLHVDELPMFKHKNGIAASQRAQAMSNHKSRSLLHQFLCRRKDGLFCNCVDRAGGLIKDQNRAVPQKSSSE